MRDIKFRVWDNLHEEWYGAESWFIDQEGQVFYVEMHGQQIIEAKDAVVMQYTGLKDKNGKEIYEGDIVKGGGSKFAVTFGPVNHDFTDSNGRKIWLSWVGFNVGEHYEHEVIGNIYENPELLEDHK